MLHPNEPPKQNKSMMTSRLNPIKKVPRCSVSKFDGGPISAFVCCAHTRYLVEPLRAPKLFLLSPLCFYGICKVTLGTLEGLSILAQFVSCDRLVPIPGQGPQRSQSHQGLKHWHQESEIQISNTIFNSSYLLCQSNNCQMDLNWLVEAVVETGLGQCTQAAI